MGFQGLARTRLKALARSSSPRDKWPLTSRVFRMGWQVHRTSLLEHITLASASMTQCIWIQSQTKNSKEELQTILSCTPDRTIRRDHPRWRSPQEFLRWIRQHPLTWVRAVTSGWMQEDPRQLMRACLTLRTNTLTISTSALKRDSSLILDCCRMIQGLATTTTAISGTSGRTIWSSWILRLAPLKPRQFTTLSHCPWITPCKLITRRMGEDSCRVLTSLAPFNSKNDYGRLSQLKFKL